MNVAVLRRRAPYCQRLEPTIRGKYDPEFEQRHFNVSAEPSTLTLIERSNDSLSSMHAHEKINYATVLAQHFFRIAGHYRHDRAVDEPLVYPSQLLMTKPDVGLSISRAILDNHVTGFRKIKSNLRTGRSLEIQAN